ncbi:hypothetical protein EFY87_19685 [Flexivirga caeni]|uniref:DUF4145 domain-containing protein n=2 Tax=Flexivirga caeni TaxID=2294115 RepID=A0A3M9LUY9_9MICO|nr:hypothetical protein EFY87_19685 [Flexivirga caeni]
MEMFGYLSEAGIWTQISPGQIRRMVAQWPAEDTTPAEVAGLLATSRQLVVCSYYCYEFLVVAVLVALQATETALRMHLTDGSSKQTLTKLIERARANGTLSEEVADDLHLARHLRNDLSHPRYQGAWTYGMALPLIERSHRFSSFLFTTVTTSEDPSLP